MTLEEPSEEASEALQRVLVQFMKRVIQEASRRTIRREQRPGNLTTNDIIYTIRGNRKMFNKISKHLLISDLNDNLKDTEERKDKWRGKEKDPDRADISEEEFREI